MHEGGKKYGIILCTLSTEYLKACMYFLQEYILVGNKSTHLTWSQTILINVVLNFPQKDTHFLASQLMYSYKIFEKDGWVNLKNADSNDNFR